VTACAMAKETSRMPQGTRPQNNRLRPEKFTFKRFRTRVRFPPVPPHSKPLRCKGLCSSCNQLPLENFSVFGIGVNMCPSCDIFYSRIFLLDLMNAAYSASKSISSCVKSSNSSRSKAVSSLWRLLVVLLYCVPASETEMLRASVCATSTPG